VQKRIKKFKYNIRSSIVRFLLRICEFLKGNCYCRNEFYYETAKVEIWKLKNRWVANKFDEFGMEELLEKNTKAPNKVQTWRELMEDIKTNGIKINPIVIKSEYGYEIYDGNHRIKILKYLYGEEYEVVVNIYLNHKKHIPYYATMGIVDEIEHRKVVIKQRLKEIEDKTYEA
tara:strand:- start:114 stop:632 length:519 start_codon:yes stop_codon:yes gene_type:complete